jgi:S-adenosylmethionine synthetase
MTISFMSSPSSRLTSESVTEGHPDKMCDQISDAVLDALLEQDPMSRVAAETATTTGTVWVFGEVTTAGYVDVEKVVRETVRGIGYESSDHGFDANTCGVLTSIKEQSPDIAQGVNNAQERREADSEDDYDRVGAGDQGMMIGFACTETDEYMPLTIGLAHRLTRRLAECRHAGTLPFLLPDGKSQVTVEYAYGAPRRLDAVVISTQHMDSITTKDLREAVFEEVIRPICPPEFMDEQTKIYVNPTGRFVIGGPDGDCGLTGRKITVDT